ncbi:clathrin light chain [Panaeolus papilionaceus]|nr:clathrin light chain [Panaeolus papilionaceus]
MSDFLSREADILGGEFSSSGGGNGNTEIDWDRAASQFPDISLDGEGDIPAPGGVARSSSGFSFDDFGTPPQHPVTITGNDELDEFENNFPEIEVPAAQPQAQPSYNAPTPFAPKPQSSALSTTPIFTQTIEDEPQVIRDWREKQQAEIKARDEASKARRNETIDKAERSIEEFYENYADKKKKAIRDNKNSEAEYLADLNASLSSGTTWERICTLIDLQNSQSKTHARTGAGTTDLTRFKDVLLRLKREGDRAPGAAGY